MPLLVTEWSPLQRMPQQRHPMLFIRPHKPQNFPFPCWISTQVVRSIFGPIWVGPQTAPKLVQPFCMAREGNRQTTLLVTPSVAIVRVLTIAAMRPNHRLRCSASPVFTATGFVNGKRQFSTPYRIDTPQPITKRSFIVDYVGDPYGCAKLGTYPSTGLLGTWVKYNQNLLFLVIGIGRHPYY